MHYSSLLASAASAAVMMATGASAAPGNDPYNGLPHNKPGSPATEHFRISHFGFKQSATGEMSDLSFNADAQYAKAQLYCADSHPVSPEPSYSSACNDDDYQFAVHFEGTENVRVRIYKFTVDNQRWWGETFIPIGCEADGQCWGADVHSKQLTTNDMVLYAGYPAESNWP